MKKILSYIPNNDIERTDKFINAIAQNGKTPMKIAFDKINHSDKNCPFNKCVKILTDRNTIKSMLLNLTDDVTMKNLQKTDSKIRSQIR